MAYKKIEYGISFADIAIQAYADKNRNLLFLREVENTIDWQPVEDLLMEHYEPGKSKTGEQAYSPLLLFKCLLLQKWFRIISDPELESQINDRISFKSFLQLPLDKPSPDHSTFSRFRGRVPKDSMVKINNNLLKQFHQHGLSINEGIAVDARLVKSVSHPVSKKDLEELIQKADTLKENWIKTATRKSILVITDLGDPSVNLPMKLKSKGSEANSRGTGIRSLLQKNSHGPFALPSTD
jgi:IS5 family transposase